MHLSYVTSRHVWRVGGCDGTDVAQMRNAIRESVSRFDKVLEAVSDPQMPSQIAWHIIRQCVVSGVGFFARITQPDIGHDTFVDFDRKYDIDFESKRNSKAIPTTKLTLQS